MTDTTTAPTETGKSEVPPSTEQPTRRRRGRPFQAKAAPGATPPLQETAVGVDPTDSPQQERQRRTRKPSIDVDALTKQLKGIHALAANLLPIRMPDGKLLLELSDTEATQLANAITGVAKEYDLALDGKTGAAIQLLAAAAMIYGPRVYVIQKMRVQMKQQQVRPQGADPVDSSVVAEQNLNGSATAATN
jgi:hypothetical protein